jgi:hypothetical protein
VSEMCCEKYEPEFSSFRQEGERFTCKDCGTVWEYVIDESQGSYWEDVDVLVENDQQKSAELAEDSFARNQKS